MNFAIYHEIMSPEKSKVASANMTNTIYNSPSNTDFDLTQKLDIDINKGPESPTHERCVSINLPQ